ncbi:MAG: hypothetical protein H0U09_15675 [Geodermatophilaceae bacterium]|nr:hypothetical protein [Geodermatophilaceae bacterium]
MTQRDLWKASGGRAGSPKRSDWKDIRGAVYGLLFLLALAVVGEEFVPGMTISPGPPP